MPATQLARGRIGVEAGVKGDQPPAFLSRLLDQGEHLGGVSPEPVDLRGYQPASLAGADRGQCLLQRGPVGHPRTASALIGDNAENRKLVGSGGIFERSALRGNTNAALSLAMPGDPGVADSGRVSAEIGAIMVATIHEL